MGNMSDQRADTYLSITKLSEFRRLNIALIKTIYISTFKTNVVVGQGQTISKGQSKLISRGISFFFWGGGIERDYEKIK